MGYRKGIILAGGKGTRLYPMTAGVNKQLLPVYDKPMIYYPLASLMSAVIRDVLIISSPDQILQFNSTLGNGNDWGMNIEYATQDVPNGIAEAFLIAENVGFLKGDPCALALGDNIFYGEDFYKDLMYISKMNENCVFGYRVANPEEYGVVDFERPSDMYERNVRVKGIEEKPANPKSNYAVPGLYFYDSSAVSKARSLKPSPRGELEITDLNNLYIKDKKLKVKLLRDSAAWFDTGAPEAMFEASMFVKSIQSRTGLMIGCVEEIAYKKEFISYNQFCNVISSLPNCQYRTYLERKYDA
tara:strand:+ start:11124 stop:12023 length:900 start_codon:yes stop_codon:yes gene_type:complete